MQLQPNTLFHNRYRLVEMKGRGSFGEVWLARDEQLDMEVAVKVYIALDDRGVADFKSEYKTTFGLNHPNLLHAYHFDQTENRPYLVMPYCPDSAMALIGNADEATLWRFIRDVASGLEYLHDKDILHHDIKPDNVLRNAEGDFLITDFGISTKMRSTLRRHSSRQANTTPMAGSIPYMAPEMFSSSAEAVKASDIWALGATLYEMAVGELPFFGQGGVMQKNGADVPDIHANYSDTFIQTVQQCLAKDTWARPTAQQLVERADAVLKGEMPQFVAPVAPPQQPSQPVNRATQVMNNPNSNVVPSQPPVEPMPPTETQGGKGKKAWIIGAVAAVVAAVLAIVFLVLPDNSETMAFEACQGVNDYRSYIATYGTHAKHYAKAKQFVDAFVADSTKRVQDSLAKVEAQRQAEAEAQARAEAEQKEEDAYKKCTTLAACDSYLKAYPQGRYLEEVKAKKAELEKQRTQQQTQQQTSQNTPTGKSGSSNNANSTTGSANGHDYVDLGLPSGTLWATCNIGASKPEGYGNYYAWGETKTKSTYDWVTYKYANGNNNVYYLKMTKYCSKSNSGDNGFTDNLTTLQAEDDPATAWGSGWRTPSKTQWDELLANTTNKWTTQNGIKGRLFTSKKNGKTLFLPAAGCRCDSNLNSIGTYGFYWSSSLSGSLQAWRFGIGSGGCAMFDANRSDGLSVRAVRFGQN